ncbi:MAG: hypothetical protein ACJ79K_14115 [Gemmatimonadaceae bacterium]
MKVAPEALVRGGDVLAMLAATGAFRKTAEQLLAGHGITAVAPDEWYSLPDYASVMHDLEHRIGPQAVFRIGKEIPNHIQLPPGLDSFEKIASAFGPAFAMNHRNAANGGIDYEVTGPGAATIVSGTPYPCDFDRGVILGFFQLLLRVTPHHQHDNLLCKKKGSAACVHYLSLETTPQR